MMLYLMIVLIFIYFKIARVHKKEEKLDLFWKLQHLVVSVVAVSTFFYAFNHIAWYMLLIVSLLSFMMAGMLITAVQLGIFVDGKPLFGMHNVYKNTIYLTLLLCCFSLLLWFF